MTASPYTHHPAPRSHPVLAALAQRQTEGATGQARPGTSPPPAYPHRTRHTHELAHRPAPSLIH
ncbi:hypothetical protein, partial [Streptomyces sp. H28]|uniref:hypothetical protein n=1 Tax=Streptomyces sp. H28 TaxID=2775865 RepID=UPI001CE12751